MELEEYVAARGASLLRFAFVLTGDAHAAQDLVQTALLKALRHWQRIASLEHPDAYVRKVLVNAHLSGRRRRSAGERPVQDLRATESGDSTDLDAVAERDALRTVLAGLTPRERTVLVLRYYLDYDDLAIADLLGVSESTVRSTSSRAAARARRTWPATADHGPATEEDR